MTDLCNLSLPLSERLTVVVPSYQRGTTLTRALQSVAAQNHVPVILVVDDGSDPPVEIDDRSLPVVIQRLDRNRGGSAARNAGVRKARTPWITFLDDDDEWLPGTGGLLHRLLPDTADHAVSYVSALEVVDETGRVMEVRRPETREQGERYFLEEYATGLSPLTKQTFVISRDLYLSIGGFDEDLRSRVHSEFSLRLNAASRIVALPDVTYRLHKHSGPQVSKNPALRHQSFHYIWRKHRDAMQARPQGSVRWAGAHARRCLAEGQRLAAMDTLWRAFLLSPGHFVRALGNKARRSP